jgi:hypothetical protein
LLPRVTNSRIKQSSSKPSSDKRLKKSIAKNLKLNRMPEDKKINKEEKEKLTTRLTNSDLLIII